MKKTLTTYLDEELIAALKITAIEQNKTLAKLLTEILQEYLDRRVVVTPSERLTSEK